MDKMLTTTDIKNARAHAKRLADWRDEAVSPQWSERTQQDAAFRIAYETDATVHYIEILAAEIARLHAILNGETLHHEKGEER